MKNVFIIKLDPRRIYGLDILRAAAILFVVFDHGLNFLPKEARHAASFFVFDGVSIFFVLSGFLIGGILLKIVDKDVDFYSLFNFWIRRWLRTIPNYFLILTLLLCVNHIFNEKFVFYPMLNYFFFTQNLFTPHPGFFPEAWSLSVEEWFYFIIPLCIFLLILFFKLSSQKAILIIIISVIILVTCYRYYQFENSTITTINEWDLIFRKQVVTRLDSIMFGLIGAYVFKFHEGKWVRYSFFSFFTGVSILIISKYFIPKYFFDFGLYNCVFSFSIFSIGVLFILPFMGLIRTGKGLLYKFITYISLISYSMYLLNLTIIQNLIINKIPWLILFESRFLIGFYKYGLYWFLVIFLSILLYKYFELPMTNLRDHITIKRRYNIDE